MLASIHVINHTIALYHSVFQRLIPLVRPCGYVLMNTKYLWNAKVHRSTHHVHGEAMLHVADATVVKLWRFDSSGVVQYLKRKVS